MQIKDKFLESYNSGSFNPVIIIPNLNAIADFVGNSRDIIVSNWVERESTIALFKDLNIEPEFFKGEFGLPVMNYFHGVITGEKELGNCPVMHRFVKYLVDVNIASRDIFILCMALRRSLIKHILLNNQIHDNLIVMIEEISDVFDANLSGVLKLFTDLRDKKERKIESQRLIIEQQKYIKTLLNSQQNLLCVIKNNNITLANDTFLDALGIDNIDIIDKEFNSKWHFISGVDYFKEFFDDGDYQSWIAHIVASNKKLVKVALSNLYSQKSRIYILKANELNPDSGEYIISFTDINEYESRVNTLKSQLYIDPLTKLPNGLKFESDIYKFISQVSTQKDKLFALYIDIDNYHQLFNHYPIEVVNEVLKKFIASVVDFNLNENYIARLNDNQLVIIFIDEYITLESINNYAKELKNTLDELIFHINDNISASYAIVQFRDGDTYAKLVKRSSLILENIKELGGNLIKDDSVVYHQQIELEKSTKNIIELIKRSTKEGKEITLYTLYRQLPLSSQVVLKRVDGKNKIAFKLLNPKILFSFSKLFLIQIDGKKSIFSANVESIDPKYSTLILKDFSRPSNNFLQRKHIRISPILKSNVIVGVKDKAVGRLMNISLKSMVVEFENIENIQTQMKVQLSFSLPDKNISSSLNINGYIKEIVKNGNYFRAVILLYLGVESENILTEYIAWQQIQIIKELSSIVEKR